MMDISLYREISPALHRLAREGHGIKSRLNVLWWGGWVWYHTIWQLLLLDYLIGNVLIDLGSLLSSHTFVIAHLRH